MKSNMLSGQARLQLSNKGMTISSGGNDSGCPEGRQPFNVVGR